MEMNASTEESEEVSISNVVVELFHSRLRGIVWKDFEKVEIEGVLKAKCLHCGKLYAGAGTLGTSHLHAHRRVCEKKIQRDMESTNSNQEEESSIFAFDHSTARTELANMIIMHEYPLSIVEHVGFRTFVCSLQPEFKCPSRNTIKKDILSIFMEEKVRVMKFFEESDGRFAVTTDMWTADNQKKGYMAITAHFIDNNWKLQSRILRFAYVPSPHTKEVLCSVLFNCLLDWNIDRRLSTVTVDNCSTNDVMITSLLHDLDRRSLILSGSLVHMRCCAHILNLVVREGLEVIKEEIERIRLSVVFWTASPKRDEKFGEMCRQLHMTYSKKLSIDCPTRWNSTYVMLDNAIRYRDVFLRCKQRDNTYTCLPSDSDWETAEIICEKLKLFCTTTETFSGVKYPTANTYFPMICELKVALHEWLSSPVVVVQNIVPRMLSKLNKYWSDIHKLMGIATILDPRYKLKLVEFYFYKIYGEEECSARVEEILDVCYNLVDEYKQKMLASCEVLGESSSQVDLGHPTDRMSEFDAFVLRSSKKPKRVVRNELDMYLDEDVLPRSTDFDILFWWKGNGLIYPTLRAIARDIFAIPVSTVASESSFSTGGRLLSPNRSRLHEDTVEALMCSQSWLWADGGKMSSREYTTAFKDCDPDTSMDS